VTLPAQVFCDTSFFYACLDPADTHHESAASLVERAAAAPSDLVTTWDVISETATLLRYRCSFEAAWTFLSEVKPTLRIAPYAEDVRIQAEEVFERYGRDHRLSYCDAISFVVVTAILDDMPCLAFDRDFRALGLTVLL